jgi:hypothetical protein
MIHNEDNGKLEMKLTSDGEFVVFCPICHGVWQTSMTTIHKPQEGRPISYGGTGINLDMGSSGKAPGKKSPDGVIKAKELFPEAFK